MKATLRLPTNHQYAFIEIETECDSIEEAHLAYEQAMAMIRNEGLPVREWQEWLINQLLEQDNHVEQMEKLSPMQKWATHEIKKALNTIKRRNQKE